jgi:hypothetical protein
MKILVDRPKNAFAEFENISAQVKTNPTNPDPEFGRPLPPSTEEVSFASWTFFFCLSYFLVSWKSN